MLKHVVGTTVALASLCGLLLGCAGERQVVGDGGALDRSGASDWSLGEGSPIYDFAPSEGGSTGDGGGNCVSSPLSGQASKPTDPDGDGLYEDLNGNGNMDIVQDVAVCQSQVQALSEAGCIAPFDFDKNGQLNVIDCGALLVKIGSGFLFKDGAVTVHDGGVVGDGGCVIQALAGQTAKPTDPDSDGLYEDLNGNGKKDAGDATLCFSQYQALAASGCVTPYDFQQNGTIGISDCAALSIEIGGEILSRDGSVAAHDGGATCVIQKLPNQANKPTDPDHDGAYEDLDGSGTFDYKDGVLCATQYQWLSASGCVTAYDFDKNGQVGAADCVALGRELLPF